LDLEQLTYLETWTDPPLSDWDFGKDFGVQSDVLAARNEGCLANCGTNAWWRSSLSTPTVSVEATFHMEAPSTGYVGVLVGAPDGDGQWLSCMVELRATKRILGCWSYDGQGDEIIPLTEIEEVEPLSAGASVRRTVRTYVAGQVIWCSFDNELGDQALMGPVQLSGVVPEQGGVRVYRADATFGSFAVYE